MVVIHIILFVLLYVLIGALIFALIREFLNNESSMTGAQDHAYAHLIGMFWPVALPVTVLGLALLFTWGATLSVRESVVQVGRHLRSIKWK